MMLLLPFINKVKGRFDTFYYFKKIAKNKKIGV